MSEPKLNAVFVRLTRDFPVGQQHRRAGITLGAGPRPVSVEVTDEQLEQLQSDHYIEIVDDKEAQKWEDRLGEEPSKTSSEVAAEAEGDKGGLNYGDGNEGGSSNDDEQETAEEKAAREAAEAEAAAEKERRATTPTVDELIADNNRDALVAKATELGVEGLDYEAKNTTTKKVIAEAIVAKRDAGSSNDDEE